MTRIAIFPGQGSQSVGMAATLCARYRAGADVLAEVDEALGFSLSSLMTEGPLETLTLTENAQPALMAASLAAVRALESETGRPLADVVGFVAGHSLGEYSALAAAGALSIADAARLLRLRGEAMQRAVPAGEGAMAAILGLDVETVETVAREAAQKGVCDLANDNSQGQAVVSGDRTAVERAVELAKAHGARRSMLLQVSAPFHCARMQPAADELAAALAKVALGAPARPLIANVTAEPCSDPQAIRTMLVTQVTARVRWRESMNKMSELGIDDVVELGAGKVLSGLAKRGVPGAQVRNIAEADDVVNVAATLN